MVCPNCGADSDNLEVTLQMPLRFQLTKNGSIKYDNFSLDNNLIKNVRLDTESDLNCYCKICGTYCTPFFDKKESPTKVIELERLNNNER